jgi:hypothetical protein
MAICKLLCALTVFVSVSSGQLLGRVPVPGAVSLQYSQRPNPLAKRSGTVDVPFGARELDYIVNITVGSPPQPIFLSLDTGSSDAILLAEAAPFCTQNAGVCPDRGYCK